MKILIVTDLHDKSKTLPPLASTMESIKPDAVFCLGDLTEHVRGGPEFTEAFLEIIEREKTPLYCISGNNDVAGSLEILEQRGYLIDYRERPLLGKTRVVGMGYAPTETPFNPILRGAILLTHLPPRRNSVPPSVTNVPRFHFAGHYHSRESIWKLNTTTVVQVPTAMNFRAALLHLPQGWVEFIDLV